MLNAQLSCRRAHLVGGGLGDDGGHEAQHSGTAVDGLCGLGVRGGGGAGKCGKMSSGNELARAVMGVR